MTGLGAAAAFTVTTLRRNSLSPTLQPKIAQVRLAAIVGGILGGWLAVEWAKKKLGILQSTESALTLPLLVSLSVGRLGCAWAGCCQGEVISTASPYTYILSQLSFDGAPRVPIPYVESVVLLAMCVVLSRPRMVARLGQFHFLVAMMGYASIRFYLEFYRENPVVVLGCTWYQILALVLFVIAALTAFARWRHTAHESKRAPSE